MFPRPRPATPDFGAIYDAYGDRIYRFCRHLCGNPADAEDLAQETFLAAFQSLGRFEGRSSLSTWLYRIALYRWQKMKRTPRPETFPYEEHPPASLSDPMDAQLDRLALERALETLPDLLRGAVLLVKVEGLKLREAAEVLGIPEGTVKSRVHEAMAKLRAALAEDVRPGMPQPCGASPRKESRDEV